MMSADERSAGGGSRANPASATAVEGCPELVRHETELTAESERVLTARLRLLADALRVRGGRLVKIRRQLQREARVSAMVAYELPALGVGRVAERCRWVL